VGRPVLARGLVGEVVSGGERAPRPGDDDHLHLVVGGGPVDRLVQAGQHRLVDGVQLLGPVEGDPRGRAARLVEDGFAHALSFRTIRQSRATARSGETSSGLTSTSAISGCSATSRETATTASIRPAGGSPPSMRPSAGSDAIRRRAPSASSGARLTATRSSCSASAPPPPTTTVGP